MAESTRPGDFDAPAEHVPTRDGYDRWADLYDADANPLIVLEEPLFRAMAGDVRGRRVADVGCGTGRHTAWLAAAGADVTAVDFSLEMIARARRKPECARADFVVHDLAVHPWPLPAGQFDLVVSGLVLEHLADVPAFFSGLHRLCRPAAAGAVVSVMHPAMWLAGVQARFTDPATGSKVLIGSHRHTLSQYVMAAVHAGFKIEQMSEHEIDESIANDLPKARKYLGWPMLVLMRLGVK